MRLEERLKLEQKVLEVMKNYPTRLSLIYHKLKPVPFRDVFQAMLHLMKSGDVCYHQCFGKSGYRRTQQGFNRMVGQIRGDE